MLRRSLSLVSLFSMMLAWSACSEGSSGADPVEPPVDISISAEEGGSISDEAMSVTLTIPPGALAEDTVITLTVLPAASKTVSKIYDFGPDGLSFLEPASLEIRLDPAAVGTRGVAVAVEQNGAYVPLADSSYENGVASASIEHFSRYAIVFTSNGGGGGDVKACEDALADFSPCGGDLTGSWKVNSMCFDTSGVLNPACPAMTSKMTVDYGAEQSFTFDGTKITSTATTVTVTATTNLPLSCFEGMVDSCAELSALDYLGSCSGSSTCSCVSTFSDSSEAESSTYTTNGNELSIENDDGEIETYKYCVQGKTLYMQALAVDEEDAQQFILVMSRP